MPIGPNTKQCGAKARQRGGLPCRQPAMANGRCRLHGGKCTRAKTEEGKLRQRMASYKHGMRSKEAMEERKKLLALIKSCKEVLRGVETSSKEDDSKVTEFT